MVEGVCAQKCDAEVTWCSFRHWRNAQIRGAARVLACAIAAGVAHDHQWSYDSSMAYGGGSAGERGLPHNTPRLWLCSIAIAQALPDARAEGAEVRRGES